MIAGLTGKIFFKVIRMSTKRLYLVMLLLLIGCQQAGIGQDKPTMPVSNEIEESELGEQLKLARDALHKGSTEQMRINAAAVLLFSKDPPARKILLVALKPSENGAVQAAVCKALIQAGAEQKPIKDKTDFIQPLLDILAADDFIGAKLAAEATLLFEYEQISKQLEKTVTDVLLPAQARLNVIYALRIQPDVKAAIKLINLLGDSERQVAAAAEEALKSLGIQVGKDAEARKKTIDELKRQGQEAFLRNRLIHQEAQIRKLGTELDVLQQLYLAALSEYYHSISDDTAGAKGKFLAKHLSGSKAIVKLWALEKVSEWWVGTSDKSNLLTELGPILLNLVSDPDKNVRLNTAKLLSLMVELNSAGKLLEQHKIEQYDDVRTEIFVALGAACSYAFLPDSPVKISPEIRKQTLGLASEYLSKQEPKKAQEGAKVIKKLLEQDGLALADVDKYLGWLVERYGQEKDKADGTLRGELLRAMADLCAQSVYKAQAKKLFRPLFEESLRDESNLVREAAVDGLVYIDKTKALKILRQDFVNDPSIVIRKKLIDIAGEVGGKGDLVWLAKKIGSTAEGDLAWQAMLKIFKSSSSDAAVLDKWIGEFGSMSADSRLSDERMISLLEIAEAKAESENKLEMLKGVRRKLADLYRKSGKFRQAADYLGRLYGTAETSEEKEAILPDLLDAYLRWPNVERAAKLVDNCLLAQDLEPNSPVVLSIDNYFAHPPPGADSNAVLMALTKINIPETRPRPMWQQQLKRWADRLGWTESRSNKPRETGN
jgi:HEAT repeat protein